MRDAELARVELLGFAHHFAQDLVADCLCGLDLAAAVAGGQGSQRMWASDSRVRLRVISTRPRWVKPFTVSRVRSVAIAVLSASSTAARCSGQIHVDEIDDDDAAKIAQAQLPRNGLRGLQIGLEDGVVERAHAGNRRC